MKKNILYICHSYSSFQKDSIELTAKYFKNVAVLVRSNPLIDISKYFHITSLEQYRSDKKIDIHNMPSNVKVYSTPIIYFPVDFQYKNLGEKHLRTVENFIEKYNIKFDIIHSNFTWSAGYVGAKLKEKYGVPFLVTAHGYDIYDLPFKDDDWRSKIEYVLNSADTIITVSNSNLECIKKLDVNTPVTVLPNGYREDLFHPIDMYESRRSLSIPFNKKVILSVGNMEEVKGYKYLIEAMTNVVKDRKDVICFIVGIGTLQSKLNSQIKSAGLQDHVELVGGKSHNEIPLWMNACDLFVLPSLKESFGVVQIEAMACGKPVVATRNGGSEEIIVSKDYGLICNPARPKELAENILLTLDINWDKGKILNYAKQYRWENSTEQIQQIYRHVLQT